MFIFTNTAMAKMNDLYRIKGVVQHYDWGGNSLLPALLNIQDPGNKPYAEFWLGAHEKASSLIIAENKEEKLYEFISENPAAILGNRVKDKFGRLPYLLKLLDVKNMLSIQVHPDKKGAEIGFAAEEQAGIPLNAPHRNYKDDNHKPEIMAALSDFWLLHGFKPAQKAGELLKDQSLKPLHPVIQDYIQDIRLAYSGIMNMKEEESDRILRPLLDVIIPLYHEGKLEKSNPSYWAAKAALTFNKGKDIDKGIYSIYLLNLVNVKPGEGIYQGPGILHAYLEGQNVELMANSDNVLRGGLTSKHIDVPELMKHVKFEPVEPKIIAGPDKQGEYIYDSPAEDFQLSLIQKETALHTSSADILLVYSGNAMITTEKKSENIFPGEAVFIPSGRKIKIEPGKGGMIFRASVPNLP